jgi:hypothetical protein
MTLARTEEMERRKAPQVDFVYNSELVTWIIFSEPLTARRPGHVLEPVKGNKADQSGHIYPELWYRQSSSPSEVGEAVLCLLIAAIHAAICMQRTLLRRQESSVWIY